MATTASLGQIETYLGAKAESLLGFKSPKIAKERPHLRRDGPQSPRAHEPAAPVWPRTPEWDWLPFDSARRSGHRALGRCELCKKSRLFRWREHREAGDRRRLQRGGFHVWRARLGRAKVRAQNSVHRKNESQ